MEDSRLQRSTSDHEITKFNSNSRQFTLGWDVKERPHPTPIISKKKEEIKEVGITHREPKFLEKKNNDIATKVTKCDIQPTMISTPTKITRNDREMKTTFNLGPDQSLKPAATKNERQEQKNKIREETNRLNNQKVEKLQTKAKAREPFKF